MNSSAPTDQTTQYARDVVSGKIVAGQFVRAQCQRHLDDLETGAARGLTWSVEQAERAIRFFPAMLSITEGAKEGEPFHLLPWHLFTVGSIFGWRTAEGFIRFRFVWLETGKGQAKSPLMAAVGIYLAGFYGRKRAEVYCIGETKDTARVMFRDAVAMLRAPIPGKGGMTLEEAAFVIRGTGDLAYKIEHTASGSSMQPLANNDAVSGPKPILVAGDEIHEMKSNKAIEMWRAAVTKKHGDSILMLGTNTPSVDQHVGTDYSIFVQKVLTGEFSDDSVFGYIARVDAEDDPLNDESCWIKALPALGLTYPVDNVRKLVVTAKQQISTQLTTKRLYFGIPVGSAGFWTSQQAWEEAQGEVDEEAMKGRRCHLALDLSEKNDLTALTAAWEGDKLGVKTWYWTRDYEVEDRSTADAIPYRELEAAGLIEITPGRVIDYTFIAARIIEMCGRHNVVQMAVDSAHLEKLCEAFQRDGFGYWIEGDDETGSGLRIVRHKQGHHVSFDGKYLCMPTSITQLEDHMLKGTVVIDKNKLTSICAQNAIIREDGFGNRMFDKARSRGRIDGVVTLAMAVGSATAAMESRASVYASRGALIL
ncbi:terminase large subunit [Sagittula sp. MA-2]|jgi:phage terminase large subunit-like protein|uniref:terminase large subunit n=1 Tax=Sagittula sp. MA-2 TaxID=3048007 RepID=UPI0024C447C1|nr:terminase TerL endonuclease subunit [Sagittula sp. MA-2]WHZ35748.1 terminase large subunit [Sagittula sp. MA-2]